MQGVVQFSNSMQQMFAEPLLSGQDRQRACPRHGWNPEEAAPRPGKPGRLPGGTCNTLEA